MGTLFGFISLSSLKGAVASLLDTLGRILFRICVFASVLFIIYPLLPADPFRSAIVSYAEMVKPYADWLNWLVDVPLIVSIMLFYAMWRYAYWVYRHVGGLVMDKDGQLSFDA